MPKYFYITTPIFYPNDRLHLGHAYTMIIADIIARYKKSQGYQVYFQTGSDDHELGISEHIFYRTSASTHKKKVQKIFTELLNEGDIYLGEYQGRYCIACEDYVSDSKVINNNLCPTPNCQSELRKIKEPAYFLRVSNYYQQLIEYYQKNPDFLLPPNIKKELFENFLKNEGRDLCITQPGETPETAAKREILEETNLTITDLEKIGEEAFYVQEKESIGEVKFFSIPEIQEIDSQKPDRGAEYVLEKLTGAKGDKNSWEIVQIVDQLGRKGSKSKGNVIDPLKLLKKYPRDLLRVYFIAKINFLQDGVFTEDLLRNFYQDFFVNNLKTGFGNFKKEQPKEKTEKKKLEEYQKKCHLVVSEFQEKINQYELTETFSQIQSLLNEKLAKKGDILLLNLTLNYLINGIKIAAFLLDPLAPETSKKILEIFNVNQWQLN
ncbi:7884_t:CDS:2 [Cetraspora pellucida]|uniref:7884_t:CDS:1 n=1 Tax=Cetraspora pellucida TaxID=1433469 RepID=A0ACA9KCH9_9GLOM|nr:7884_t:CDS:2 [Cetraspora pellucida]